MQTGTQPEIPEITPTELKERLDRGDGVARLLRTWAAPGWPDSLGDEGEEILRRYTRAMQLPFVAHTAMEYYRWAVRSVLRRDGRRFADAIRDPVTVPVLQVHGARDPWIRPETAAASRRWAAGPARYEILPAAGHFLPEEEPDRVNALLGDWLGQLPPPPP